MSASYGLTLAGGIIVLLGGVLMVAMGGVMAAFIPFIGPFVALFGLWGLISGIIIIYSAYQFGKKEHRKYSTLGLIFSILALVTMQGFIIGPILSLIGTAMAHGEGKK